jgi:ABC-2 type transport system permease protein
MSELIRSAFVIARRDFAATVFSKTFLFFLVGPLFPLLLGGLFGGIGAHVASESSRPVVAVVAPAAEFARLEQARAKLAAAIGPEDAVLLHPVEPQGDLSSQRRRLLESKDPPIVAVLSGVLSAPQLTGSVQPDGTIVRQLRLLIDDARAPPTTGRPLAVTAHTQSTGVVAKNRALTAQASQFLLFFLTLLLAGMLLSQLIEEKSSKVIEVLAAAVRIDAIFLGKLFAMLATSLVGIVVWVTAGAIAIDMFAPRGLGSLPEPAVGWLAFFPLVIIYFAMNYLLLGAVFLSIGAQASTAREVQTLSMPVTMIQVLIVGFAAVAIGEPNSARAIGGAVFPLSSPLVMVARAAEEPELWPHLLAIAWQTLWVGLILQLGAKLFRRSVLKSGTPIRWFRRARA